MLKADLHIHSVFSDGCCVPSEIAQRYMSLGFDVIAITDHCDASNLEFVLESLITFVDNLPKDYPLKVLPGVELTHVPPSKIGKMISLARTLGARVVVVHGESPVEPVAEGTNLSAIEAGCDILAHPGFISEREVELARIKGVRLEITTRSGHCYANGWVLRLAREIGASVVVNNDAHAPKDMLPYDVMRRVLRGAGADEEFISRAEEENERFLRSLISAGDSA